MTGCELFQAIAKEIVQYKETHKCDKVIVLMNKETHATFENAPYSEVNNTTVKDILATHADCKYRYYPLLESAFVVTGEGVSPIK